MSALFVPCPLAQTACWCGLTVQLGTTSTVLARPLGGTSCLLPLSGGKSHMDILRRNLVNPL